MSRNLLLARLGALAGGLAALVACAKPGPPPAAADEPIALTGSHAKLDLVETDKYLHYAIGSIIEAPPEVVWGVLTDADRYTEWNSTLVSFSGDVAMNGDLELVAKISPKRKFKLTVTEFTPAQRLVWEDGNNVFKGVRTFTLAAHGPSSTAFTMREAFTGAMIKPIAKRLPDFGPDFDAFAADLKVEAERVAAQ